RRGGWTWYTGAAGWFYRAGLEWVLGLQVRGDRLIFEPCIPVTWPGYSLTYRHHDTCYEITVENPNGATRGVAGLELDGERQSGGNGIQLKDDGQPHRVRVVMGEVGDRF
ncbi:glycosyl hydrolase family 65 protein, partial [Methylomonas rivi]